MTRGVGGAGGVEGADESEQGASRGRSWSKELPPGRGPFDCIVIGSGMGGMTAAAMLSRLGKRVLVLEQHYTPGGFTHMFKRPGYVWDVGVHAVGEVTERSLTGRILRDLSGGELQWAPLGSVYEEFHFPGDVRIDFADNPGAFREGLLQTFPDGADAIDGYFAKVREVGAGMRGYYLARLFPHGARGVADAHLKGARAVSVRACLLYSPAATAWTSRATSSSS